jgi:ribonucleoside-diphosphate reductase beta chain
MLGLNADILKQYMKWLTNSRMRSIGLNPIFEKVENPISWIKNWTNSKDVQTANQETEQESYLIGSLNGNLDELEFDF